MKSTSFRMTQLAAALAVASMATACSTWDSMNHTQQGTAVGAGSGAVAGAVVAGPAGAVVGGVAGGAVGHEAAKDHYGSSANNTASVDNDTGRASSAGARYNAAGNESTNRPNTSSATRSANTRESTTESNNSAMGSQQGTRENNASSASSSSDNISSAQQALNDQGYNAGPVDGIMGPKTAAALRKFQSSSGLPSTGRLDSATMAALNLSSKAASS